LPRRRINRGCLRRRASLLFFKDGDPRPGYTKNIEKAIFKGLGVRFFPGCLHFVFLFAYEDGGAGLDFIP
jgi:hypothetical protein